VAHASELSPGPPAGRAACRFCFCSGLGGRGGIPYAPRRAGPHGAPLSAPHGAAPSALPLLFQAAAAACSSADAVTFSSALQME